MRLQLVPFCFYIIICGKKKELGISAITTNNLFSQRHLAGTVVSPVAVSGVSLAFPLPSCPPAPLPFLRPPPGELSRPLQTHQRWSPQGPSAQSQSRGHLFRGSVSAAPLHFWCRSPLWSPTAVGRSTLKPSGWKTLPAFVFLLRLRAVWAPVTSVHTWGLSGSSDSFRSLLQAQVAGPLPRLTCELAAKQGPLNAAL